MDALAEFKLITNGYAAELGRTAGGVINLITKSGTVFHGSLFEFYRNEKMDAKNFLPVPAPLRIQAEPVRRRLGGPIRKSNTFFSAITRSPAAAGHHLHQLRSNARDANRRLHRPEHHIRSLTRTPYPANRVPAGAMDRSARSW
jgi:hypothetical protein